MSRRRLAALAPWLALALVAAPSVGARGAGPDGGSPATTPFVLGLPDRPWRLLVDLPGFRMGEVQRPPGGARVRGTDDGAGLEVSLTLATSPQDPSPRSCRDHDWAGRQRAPIERTGTRLTEQADRARVEFLVPRIEGETVEEKNVLVYLQRDGVCVVVHLSKLHYRPSDDPGLERLLASVRIGA